MEGSFADAANNHGFKRSRWRGLWRQRIQDYMIAAVQNVRILVRERGRKWAEAMAQGRSYVERLLLRLFGGYFGRNCVLGAVLSS